MATAAAQHIVVVHPNRPTKPPLSDRLAYSVREAGQVIGCGHNTIYSLIRTGRLHTVRIGKRVFVRRDEIDRFLRESEI